MEWSEGLTGFARGGKGRRNLISRKEGMLGSKKVEGDRVSTPKRIEKRVRWETEGNPSEKRSPAKGRRKKWELLKKTRMIGSAREKQREPSRSKKKKRGKARKTGKGKEKMFSNYWNLYRNKLNDGCRPERRREEGDQQSGLHEGVEDK